MPNLTISQQTQRRFILGLQGLWPGRRWIGKTGAAQAIVACEAVQVDPVNVIAPSHDLVLWGRVAGYLPNHLEELMEYDREFFSHGGGLYIYPMSELPYHRYEMDLYRERSRYKKLIDDKPELFERLVRQISEEGPAHSRVVVGEAVQSYRSSKDSGVALYYLWLIGELMITKRKGRDRVYDLTQRVAPAEVLHAVPTDEAIEYMTLKSVRMMGMVTAREFRALWQSARWQPVSQPIANDRLQALLDEKLLASVSVEGRAEVFYYLAEYSGLLGELAIGLTPTGWQPIAASTLDEVTFLSPLEYVSARGRAKKLFGFEYIWEIYKPVHIRQYGPYTLPILFGDELVGRMDARLDRKTRTLHINGLWMEAGFGGGSAYNEAFEQGLANLARFLQAEQVARP